MYWSRMGAAESAISWLKVAVGIIAEIVGAGAASATYGVTSRLTTAAFCEIQPSRAIENGTRRATIALTLMRLGTIRTESAAINEALRGRRAHAVPWRDCPDSRIDRAIPTDRSTHALAGLGRMRPDGRGRDGVRDPQSRAKDLSAASACCRDTFRSSIGGGYPQAFRAPGSRHGSSSSLAGSCASSGSQRLR